MRTIKFRSWREDEKRMRYGVDISEVVNTENGECYNSQTKNLMQFTGILDKNGKEIYEGDLIKLENWEPKMYEVVYNRGGFCLKFGQDSHFYPDIKYAEDSVVVGNIYEK